MKKAILGAFGALLIASFACSIFLGGPSFPDAAVPPATEAILSLQDQIKQALVAGAQSGIVSVQLSEAQLTSYLQAKSAEQADPVITDPRVLLREDQMTIYGKAQSGIFRANVSISMRATTGSDGQALLEITGTDLGPLPAPQALNEALSAFVREAFTGWLGPVAIGFRLESITMSDGVMTITGRIK